MFDKSYYENSNYASYLERKERYERLCEELHFDLFKKLNLDFSNDVVIDWGCAVGFVVNGFRKIGFKNVCGYDVSDWAIEWGKQNLNLTHNITSDVTKIIELKNCKLLTAFDVFEHMNVSDVHKTLTTLRPKYLLVRIPVSKEDGGRYVLDVSEKDPTHITRLTKQSWIDRFNLASYQWLFDVKLGLMYDTSGVMCSMFRTY